MGNGECYTNKNGRDVYPYAIVSATNAEKAAYKKIQGDRYRQTDDGQPIWYASESYGRDATLEFTRDKSKVYCPLRNQRKAVISQMRSSGINVDKSAENVLAQMFSMKVSSSNANAMEEESEQEETPAKGKGKGKSATNRTKSVVKKALDRGIDK